MTFNFKQFSVRQDDSALKVGTDAVLLGAAMSLNPGSDIRGLDIGTGTGVIALMAAQRLSDGSAGRPEAAEVARRAGTDCDSDDGCGLGGGCDSDDRRGLGGGFRITGIDCDGPSAAEAAFNFAASPWAPQMEALHLSLEEYAETDCGSFDFIFSNPPYYDSSLRNPDPRVSTARHFGCASGQNFGNPGVGADSGLSMKDVIVFASTHLNHPNGHLALILPAESAEECRRCAASFGLRLFRRLDIRTTAAKAVRRCVLEFGVESGGNGLMGHGRMNCAPLVETLVLQNGASRTPEYAALTKDFYL